MKYLRWLCILGFVFAWVLSGCTGEAIITPGRYSLSDSYTVIVDFMPDGRYYLNNHEYYDLSFGTYTVANDQVTFVEGKGECNAEPGVYTVSQTNRQVTFKTVKDSCPNRQAHLTRTPFIRLRQQNPYVIINAEYSIDQINYVGVDSEGNFFTTDGLASVTKYDSSGNRLFSWGNVQHPGGVYIDPEGNIFVANADNLTISKFDPNGEEILNWTVGTNVLGPGDMGLDAAGNVYVLLKNVQDHYVEKYSPDGTPISSWAGQGKNKGQVWGTFNYSPAQIAVDTSGNNYVPDPNNDRVLKFDQNGIFLSNLTGDADRNLVQPKYVDVDLAGNVYVLDNGQTLWKFDPSGKPLGKWFSLYWGPIAVDKDANLLIADWNTLARVQLAEK